MKWASCLTQRLQYRTFNKSLDLENEMHFDFVIANVNKLKRSKYCVDYVVAPISS